MTYNIGAIVLALLAVLWGTVVSARGQAVDSIYPASVTGAWRLNAAESDDMTAKVQRMIVTNASAVTDTSRDSLPSINISLVHPDTIVIADSPSSAMTINEGYKSVVLTRTVVTDGAVNAYELQPGANYTIQSTWKKDVLRVETVSPRGNRMIETYAPAEGGKKLDVTVRIQNPTSKEIISIHRTYDRVLLDLSAGTVDFQ